MQDSPETAVPAAPPANRRWGDLGVRATSGVVLVAIALSSARYGGLPFLVVWFFAGIAVLREWQRLAGGPALIVRLLIGAVAIVAAGVLAQSDPGEALLIVLVAAATLAAIAGPGLRSWAGAGMVYAGLFVVSVVSLRLSVFFGIRAIIWLFATVWSTDVFAYFGGRLIGGPKLWPRISPSKTWSGTVTGLAAGAAIGTYVAVRDLGEPTALVPVFVLSLVAAALSQAGDAFESALKRHFEVKDSGRLIPGHGGVMDRLDGFIAAAIFAFLVGIARGFPSVAGGLFYWG